MNTKKAIGLGALVIGAACCGAWGAASAWQPEGEHPGKRYIEELTARASDPNAMARYMQLMEKGPGHEFLALMEGSFEATNRMWMDPAGEPMVSQGKAEHRMIMDGRYLKMTYEGDMMGMPFTGEGVFAYDNNRRAFRGTWIDSMSVGIAVSQGNMSRDGTSLNMVVEMDEPITGEMAKSFLQKWKLVDNDTIVLEMWEILYGDPFKVMEIEYTRKSK